ncbi:MAG: NAD-dependent malic enzyme [Gammaproteobacteria bacterium]|nr:NAD-dependent malic enzyme [Gammaproteobacteria bacterium]MDH3767548.1 NAD-dependent malic enzyme [Gammaproteobacteria bacterium]
MNARTETLTTSLRGNDLLIQPFLNKSSAFDREERKSLGLEGLLPDYVSTMAEQVTRVRQNLLKKKEPLEQYIGLSALQERNEHLFYELLARHLEDFAPIIYTPTVGHACQRYSHIFRHSRGLWITPDHQGRMEEILGNAPGQDIQLIVATDNERILGLGDQGAGGMCIPIGKLALYTVAAGIHPARTLPISLDVGTDNEELQNDPLYLGWRHPRLRGERYDALVDEFVQAVKRCFPGALLQWEDFKKANALNLLQRYRQEILSFNDDIQGTGAVGLSGVLAGSRAAGIDIPSDLRVVIVGAGAAGTGIGSQIRHLLRRKGVTEEQLTKHVAITDSRGLLTEDRKFSVTDEYKREFVWGNDALNEFGLAEKHDLQTVVEKFKPNVLIGTTGHPNTFNEQLVRAMAKHAARPIIFPFSNPNSKSEACPEDLIAWTDGQALVATGSPFPPVEYKGRTIETGQGNNVFIFPGVGLGALAVGAREVTGTMFAVAAETLADLVPEESLQRGMLFPRLARLRDITLTIAEEVGKEAVRDGLADVDPARVHDAVAASIWDPVYPKIVPA